MFSQLLKHLDHKDVIFLSLSCKAMLNKTIDIKIWTSLCKQDYDRDVPSNLNALNFYYYLCIDDKDEHILQLHINNDNSLYFKDEDLDDELRLLDTNVSFASCSCFQDNDVTVYWSKFNNKLYMFNSTRRDEIKDIQEWTFDSKIIDMKLTQRDYNNQLYILTENSILYILGDIPTDDIPINIYVPKINSEYIMDPIPILKYVQKIYRMNDGNNSIMMIQTLSNIVPF
jgi:hypothetical protein